MAAPKIRPCYMEREFIKPSDFVKRQLFGSSDRRETKRMFDEMLHFESQRLKRTWNLDIRDLNSPTKTTIGSAENVADFSMSKSCRFEWKKEDASTVPLFYRQHRHVHHSDLRLKHPLGTLDTNQLPTEILPRSSTLPSPVKLTHNRGELSMVKRVPAIKQKLFHESPTPKKAENSASSNAVNVEKKISEVVPPSFHSKVTSSSSATSNTSNSESFSRKRKNFDNAEKQKIQLKITDFIPVKRTRLTSTKPSRHESANDVHVATTCAQ